MTQAVGAGLAFVFLPLSARSLGLEAFGIVGLATTIQLMVFILDGCNVFTRLVAQSTATSETSERNARARALVRVGETGYGSLLLVGTLIGLLIASPVGAHMARSATMEAQVIAEAIVILVAGTLAKLLASFYRGCVVGALHVNHANAIALTSNVLRFPGAYASSLLLPDVRLFLLVQLTSFVMEALLLRTRISRLSPVAQLEAPAAWAKQTLLHHRRFIAGTFGLAAITAASAQTDKFLLATTLPLQDYGAVTLAILVCSGLFVLSTPIHQVFLPRIAGAKTPEDSHTQTQRLMASLVLVATPAAALFIAYPHGLARAVAPSSALAETIKVSQAFFLYGTGNCLSMLSMGLYLLYFCRGELRRYTSMILLYLALYLPMTWCVVDKYGAAGTGTIWLLGNAALLVALFIDAIRTGLLPPQNASRIGSRAGLAAASCGASYWLPISGPSTLMEALAVASIIAVLAAMACFALLRPLLRGRGAP